MFVCFGGGGIPARQQHTWSNSCRPMLVSSGACTAPVAQRSTAQHAQHRVSTRHVGKTTVTACSQDRMTGQMDSGADQRTGLQPARGRVLADVHAGAAAWLQGEGETRERRAHATLVWLAVSCRDRHTCTTIATFLPAWRAVSAMMVCSFKAAAPAHKTPPAQSSGGSSKYKTQSVASNVHAAFDKVHAGSPATDKL